MILSVVSIVSINDNRIIPQAEKATGVYEIEERKEELSIGTFEYKIASVNTDIQLGEFLQQRYGEENVEYNYDTNDIYIYIQEDSEGNIYLKCFMGVNYLNSSYIDFYCTVAGKTVTKRATTVYNSINNTIGTSPNMKASELGDGYKYIVSVVITNVHQVELTENPLEIWFTVTSSLTGNVFSTEKKIVTNLDDITSYESLFE